MLNALFISLVSDSEPKCRASPPAAFTNRFGILWCDVPVGVRGTNQDLRGKGAIALADSTLT